VPTAAETCALALQHHQAGHLNQAEQLYRQVLQADPGHADAHHLLGALAYQLGRYDQAVTSIRQAISVNPGAAIYYSNLGLVHEALGQLEEAVAHYQDALRLEPGFAEAHSNLGKTLQAQGRLEEAVSHLQTALRIRPDYAEAHNNLGTALVAQERIDEAEVCFRRALQINPNFAKAYNNLGNAFEQKDKREEAIRCFRQALTIDPNFVEAHDNLGITFERHDNVDEAIRCFQNALRIKPDFARGHYNLGCALMDQGRPDLAVACFEEALRLKPDLTTAQSNLLFALNYDPQADPDAVFAAHCSWGRLHEQTPLPGEKRSGTVLRTAAKPQAAVSLPNDPAPERRLRIGYVSPDLRAHALTRYLEPVLANHDPRQVEVICYAEVPHPDAVTTHLQSLVQGWRWTNRLKDAEVAQGIRDDGIDILVDLAGHTRNSRLLVFARKPAPVQVTWLGYMNTTGLAAMDYRLTDEVLDPPGQPVRDTEELMRLPGGMCCFAPPVDAPAVAPLPALRENHFTFGSLHNLFKLNGRVFDHWSAVLRALPTARLLMFHQTLTGTACEHLRHQFTERGIAKERLDLRRGSSVPGYLGVYGEIDVSLDAFPCTGGVTTCESMWMGVPVLTLAGVRPAGRNSAALLASVGLTDWTAQTPEQYVALAVRHANDLDRLTQLRAGLRDRMSATLCDARRFTRVLEDAYRTMWRRWCAKQKEQPQEVK